MAKRKLTRKRIIDAIAEIAFDDIGRYLSYETDGEGHSQVRLRDSGEIDTRNIQEISLGRDGRLSFKLYSRERALYKLADLVEAEHKPGQTAFLEALRASLQPDEPKEDDLDLFQLQ